MKIISAEELFYLGKLMNARYIDYDYIRMMKDIQKKGVLKESEYMAGLVNRGLLYEDFSGQKELDLDLEELLKPIFFGDFESEFFYQKNMNEKNIMHHKFHFYEGKVSLVQLNEGKLQISSGEEKLDELEKMVISETYEAEAKEVAMNELNKEKIDSIMLLKNMKIGKYAMNSQFIKHDNIWYVGKKENIAESLSKKSMTAKWNQMMKGANE